MAKMTLDELVSQLGKVYGSGLRAAVLYGSTAAGEHIAKRSDYNVLVLVDALDVDTLEREASVARAWAEAGNPPPLMLTVEEWRSSADIFPMEYADILGRHQVLHGTLPSDGIRVDREHLRLQAEHEAMGKLLALRQGVLASGGDRKRLIELLERSLSTFMVIFRATLRLHGEEPPTDYEALSTRVGELAGLDSTPFVRVVRHVRRNAPLAASDAPGVLAGYLAGVQRLVAHIDGLGGRGVSPHPRA
ncbi:MAG TPA: hypothetical protein VHH32_07995 [Gemmatimonadales bacterium]|nr:hypothetical protein [Gemmatimonadales bacterium]